MNKKRKYSGLWCAWCSIWVKPEDTEKIAGEHLHKRCGYIVERGVSNIPINYTPVSPQVKQEQQRACDMHIDFMRNV